ncbi:hypothetical protein LAZ67_15000828 [Cordylochernes scorpioides]|uniref:Ig-like domain-containing protein n=1 Tax=Cordylochernes scorpioides TaxID=51811 RepID=A0ABY6L8B6_9ARAC|nr:hypothetical protein LAZ67_15000828 [Cordylochernes scorpioides]
MSSMCSADPHIFLNATRPRITGEFREGQGEVARLNCTSSPGSAPPELEWFVDGEPVTSGVTRWQSAGVSTIGLRLHVPSEAQLVVRCTATLRRTVARASQATLTGARSRTSGLRVEASSSMGNRFHKLDHPFAAQAIRRSRRIQGLNPLEYSKMQQEGRETPQGEYHFKPIRNPSIFSGELGQSSEKWFERVPSCSSVQLLGTVPCAWRMFTSSSQERPKSGSRM